MNRLSVLSSALLLVFFWGPDLRLSSANAHAPSSSFSFEKLQAFSFPIGSSFHKFQQRGSFFESRSELASSLSPGLFGILLQGQASAAFFGGVVQGFLLILAVLGTIVYGITTLALLIGNIVVLARPNRTARLIFGIIGACVSSLAFGLSFIGISTETALIFTLPSALLLGLSIANIVLGALMPVSPPVQVLPFAAPDSQGRLLSGILVRGTFQNPSTSSARKIRLHRGFDKRDLTSAGLPLGLLLQLVGTLLSSASLLLGLLDLSVESLLLFTLPSALLLGLSIALLVVGMRMPKLLPVSLLPFVTPDPQGRPVSDNAATGENGWPSLFRKEFAP